MRTHFFSLILFTSLSGVMLADQITLKNGDVVSGQIIKKDACVAPEGGPAVHGDCLTIKSDFMGEVTVPWTAVTSVKSDNPLYVKLPNGKEVNGKLSTESNNVEVTSPAATETAPIGQVATIRNAAEQQKYEKLQSPNWLQLWAGYLDIGFALARGNSHTDTLTTAFNATRETNNDKTVLFMKQVYSTGTIGGVTGPTADAILGGVSYDHNINSRWFWQVFMTDGYDTFQDLNYRFVGGGDLGYHAIKTETTTLDLLVGGDYSRSSFSAPPPGSVRNLGEVNAGDNFTHKVLPATSLTQSLLFYYAPSDGEYRLLFNAGAATTLHKWLSWQVSVTDSYLSKPVFGRKGNDILLTTGFRATFAR